jgi:hypothetical protein
VGTDLQCYEHLNFVAHFRFDPVFVPFDVEDHSVIGQEAGARIPGFDVSWASPSRFLHFRDPRVQRPAYFGVLGGKSIEMFSANHPHYNHQPMPVYVPKIRITMMFPYREQ